MGEAEACGDRIFSVATGLAQGWILGCRNLGSSIATEACAAACSACATGQLRTQCVHDWVQRVRTVRTTQTCDIVQCCALFKVTVWNTIHEHYS